ncbi:NAD(P)-binding protein [Annulohypoxylon truncatum]|uniref:NAD(P)-binding protein n=1 Tax=Annulohypoxylon truncatum TaxID=327061 RepID=UPI002008A6B1|nr:NAD(P)-binding protein [Annulohypoxylon truncatum]KAI1205181.1 NAD(P)-binding protein [Annulohypoxylon truncatum]
MLSAWKPLHTGQRLCKSFSRFGQVQQHYSFSNSTSLAMNIARVTAWGKPPQYITGGPSLPDPSPSQLQLKMLAIGVPRAVRGRASGKHSTVEGGLPFDPSIDGVGLDEATGNKYYIVPLVAPLFAERANVERHQMIQLPSEADPVTVAGLVNPVSSSWMALSVRAIGGCKGRTVFIVGATTESGRHAIRVARELGAAKIVGASRTQETLNKVEGLDERVLLTEPFEVPKTVGPLDIVLDFVGGPTNVAIMKTAEIHEGLQYISIGGVSGHENLEIPAAVLSRRPIRIMGSGMGSFSMPEVMKESPGLVNFLGKMKRPENVVTAALADVETAWDSAGEKERLVLVP